MNRFLVSIHPAIRWVLVGLWACFIFFMSAHTSSGISNDIGIISALFNWLKDVQTSLFGADADYVSSLGHFCEYTIFGMLLTWALSYYMGYKKAAIIALCIASCYGITDEIHQIFVPTRCADPMDWLVDTLGGSLGAVLIGTHFNHYCPKDDNGNR